MFKLKVIRIFDNRKVSKDQQYVPIKGAKYEPKMSEERKR